MAPIFSPWTEIMVEELKRLWAEGYSATLIAGMLGDGMTRCAVLGKINRLGLERRKPPLQRKDRAPPVKRGRPIVRRPVFIAAQTPPQPPQLPQPEPDVLTEPKSRKLLLLQLQDHHCKWPTEGPPVFKFCGARRRGDGPYCRYHSEKAIR